MKRVMFIIVFGILFGFGQNMFGYKWNLRNDTGEQIYVKVCVGTDISDCQGGNMPAGTTDTFIFSHDPGDPNFFRKKVEVGGQSFNLDDFISQTGFGEKASGSGARVFKDGTNYKFEAI